LKGLTHNNKQQLLTMVGHFSLLLALAPERREF
jgi:hypothetical protein